MIKFEFNPSPMCMNDVHSPARITIETSDKELALRLWKICVMYKAKGGKLDNA